MATGVGVYTLVAMANKNSCRCHHSVSKPLGIFTVLC